MKQHSETIVWVSGATGGLGLGLARNCPYPGARIINLSRREHPVYETVKFDMTRMETWKAVSKHFEQELSHFEGKRAIFIHNAYYTGTPGFAGEVDDDNYMDDLIANGVAPLMLGNMFLRSVRPGYESGLVQISSASARVPMEGLSTYCAAKAAMEHWVRVVRRERKQRGTGPWVVAVRPGFVDTPGVHRGAGMSARDYPLAPQIARQLESGEGLLDIDTAARDIWSGLPPKGDTSVLLFGEHVKQASVAVAS